MSGYRLSGEADSDIEEIARFSVERWGWRQAETYLEGLHTTLETLAAFPEIGRRIDHIRSGYRRFDHASHAVYYRIEADGVLIGRVLHGRMLPNGRI